MASEQQHFEASRRWQEHYQQQVEDIGLNIPPPTLGQSTNDYRPRNDAAAEENLYSTDS